MTWIQWGQNRVAPFLLISLTVGFASEAFARDAGHGRVSMKGAIVERPCAIDVGDRDQTLVMDTIPVSQIVRDGRGPQKAFSIRLVDCVLSRLDPHKPDWQGFTVTFDGEGDRGHFAVSGEAKGVAVAIADEVGNQAQPGRMMPPAAIIPSEMLLRYTVNLVGNRETLRAGDYHSAIRFRMDYY
ncbi:type 1 fimbrial protein (plasmid) [Serratia sp. JSRIV001]|uniref:fimbrial protein n=1 Tax=unclassified Serratia (in: enterobacteria) TaxID=2647522 RepID=UPI001CBE4907|nr:MULTISPECIES: fimbrial protein [unclassified Serratia (in: enterobacteria)]UAN45225.1 type 1 fimbrial protein [Serratia sp. JSRIV001]UAN48821.1 type 1 fimbrial protein [Serratia sp. JSRIV001]UAN50699.1 type 1 fimbrial protein [Serratia sp. JSRIV002]UAN54547.1 type 1 fimbrial protein [Serratia sp. JSRIV002]UAN56646.1 type 1 fimbrial protein [Serratia sp. JSRIV004]